MGTKREKLPEHVKAAVERAEAAQNASGDAERAIGGERAESPTGAIGAAGGDMGKGVRMPPKSGRSRSDSGVIAGKYPLPGPLRAVLLDGGLARKDGERMCNVTGKNLTAWAANERSNL